MLTATVRLLSENRTSVRKASIRSVPFTLISTDTEEFGPERQVQGGIDHEGVVITEVGELIVLCL